MRKIIYLLFICAASISLLSSVEAANIVLNVVDDAGQGFNDPTAAAPVGGNAGTTVGAQRRNVFLEAAQIWGNTLTSGVTIVVQSTFQDRGFTPCTANSAVLGAAGTIQIFSDFDGLLWPHTWYHSALANKLHGSDITPGPFDSGFLAEPFNDDIIAFFNPNIGTTGCLPNSHWYYGLDNNAPEDTIDLLNVVVHELGHGLGFANFTDEDGGQPPNFPGSNTQGLPDVYNVYTRDNSFQKQWNQMNNLERALSATNTRNVVWNGPVTTADVPSVLDFALELVITAPGSIAGTHLEFGTASFGPIVDDTFGGTVVLVNDGSGTTSDGCQTPFTNAGAVAGNIALIDRGSCSFELKTKNAQLNGATGVIIANNVAGSTPPGLGGDATVTGVTIPAISITQSAGNLVKANLPGVVVDMQENTSELAGTDGDGHARLYAPNPVEPGSSISHWDTTARPNLIMEPFISPDLEATTDLDLTPSVLADEGWDGNLHCPDSSVSGGTVEILLGLCDTGVTNYEGPFTVLANPQGVSLVSGGFIAGGCTLQDVYTTCNSHIRNFGQFSQCVQHISQSLFLEGVLTATERDQITKCLK